MTEELNVAVVDTPIGELHLNERNPRRISDERLEALAKSIEAEPAMLRARPVVALPDGTIIAGNMRWRAAQLLGYDTIPTVTVDLDDDRARLWLLRDNNEYGEWDDEGLTDMLRSMANDGLDLMLTGFAEDDLSRLLVDDPPPDPEDRQATQAELLAAASVTLGDPPYETHRGDVWRLGPHHLVVGSVYTDWTVYAPLLHEDDLLVPYPTPIVAITERANDRRLVMVQPDAWLAGHTIAKYAEVHGADSITKL